MFVVFLVLFFFFFFKQKTAYEMRISDWSSDVCSSDLGPRNFWFFMPATFTMAPSGAKLPRRPTTPPVGVRGLEQGRTTSWSDGRVTPSSCCSMVLPVTVMQSPCR